MLKKYENFYKISKAHQCNLYQANKREDMNKVLIKRIKSPWSWNQMLKSKSLKIQSTAQYFPKVLQIFKHKGNYFVVYEIPYGPALWFAQSSIKMDVVDFYQICNNILNCIIDLKKEISSLYVYPQWIFLHRNTVKLAHFEPYFQSKQKKEKKQEHVFMYDLMKGSYKKDEESNQQIDTKRIKNLNFNLGYIAYHLLTGETTQWRQDEKDYYEQIKIIQKSAKSKILYETNDQILAQMVQKLLTFTTDPNQFESNDDQNEAFQKFRNYICRKLVDCKICKKSKEEFRIVEFSLQKIKLQSKPPQIATNKKKKCFRQCCVKKFQEDAIPSDQNCKRFRVVESYLKNDQEVNERIVRMKTQHLTSKSPRKIKENSESTNKFISRQKINSSCLLPQVNTQRKNKKLQQKFRVHQNRSTMFRKSLHSNGMGTLRTYLRTEYD